MTTNDFLNESLNFEVGKIIVVSGSEFDPLWALVQAAKDKIEAETPKLVLAYDSRQTTLFDGHRENPFGRPNPAEPEGLLFENISLTAENDFVVIVANQFDPDNPRQNRHPRTLTLDVMLDLIRVANVGSIIATGSTRWGGVRELFEFTSRVYFYNTRSGEVTLVKAHQGPFRP